MKKLPDHLSRECIIAAIRAYDAGVAHQFKSARLYEIEFEGRRYPSKAIVGLAATLATGTEFILEEMTVRLWPVEWLLTA
ncbi:TPA: HNH endonuclease [Klebsiella pneumoniae]|nr:HNH endonuclease [Klebsiella pneumoniae]